MKSLIITMSKNDVSTFGTKRCIESHAKVGNEFDAIMFEAITGDTAPRVIAKHNLVWTYPWFQPEYHLKTGLVLTPYKTNDRMRRIACFCSHYMLWHFCAESDEPIIVLEHDAIWLKKLDVQPLLDSSFGCIGLNDPRGATRRSSVFHTELQSSMTELSLVPTVDDFNVPQGLAGNSAYLIKPWAAVQLIDKVKEIGAWPNDALMCKQNFDFLGVTKTYYTKTQGLPSTTTL